MSSVAVLIGPLIYFITYLFILHENIYEPAHDKPNKMTGRQDKSQICMCIRLV